MDLSTFFKNELRALPDKRYGDTLSERYEHRKISIAVTDIQCYTT